MEKIENKISYDIHGAIFKARGQRRSEDGDGEMKGLRECEMQSFFILIIKREL